jgi:hypothetical protein
MLWIVQPVGELGYDCNWGFVIRAASEFQARSIAQEQIADEKMDDPGFWLNSSSSTCTPLDAGGVVGVILRDFHAG